MDITHNLNIKASPETVYNAVSTHQGINGWWSKNCQVSETVGGDSILKFDKQGTIVRMDFRTEQLIPNEKVIWTCIKNGNPMWIGTKIITEIKSTAHGSEVQFSHAGFDEAHAGKEGFEMTKSGWDHFVNSLVSYCENGEGQPW